MCRGSTLAIIPARSGSPGLADKNIRLYNGMPLALHSYRYAKEDALIDKVVVTTDSPHYVEILIAHGIQSEDLILRPRCLAEDFVVDYPVAAHAWATQEELTGKEYDLIIWLRPTSPMRNKRLIKEGIDILVQNPKASSVRAVRPVTEHPYRMWRQSGEDGSITGITGPSEAYNIPRQLLPQDYFFQSGEIEITRRSTLQSGSFSGTRVFPLKIDGASIDIDNLADFKRLP